MTPTARQTAQERQDGTWAPSRASDAIVVILTRPGAPEAPLAHLGDERGRGTERGQVGGAVGAHGEILQ